MVRRDELDLVDFVSVPMDRDSGGCNRVRSRDNRAADSDDFVNIRADCWPAVAGLHDNEDEDKDDASDEVELAESSSSEVSSDELDEDVDDMLDDGRGRGLDWLSTMLR